MIPSNDPGASCRLLKEDIVRAIHRVLDSGRYILADEVQSFENEFASFLGGGHASGVASGTDALELALRACDIGCGDAVLTVSHTAAGTITAIERCGAVPVFCDIDPRTFTLSPGSAERCLHGYPGLKFKALLPVHLYGQTAEMGSLLDLAKKHSLMVIEDCAQAHGAEWRNQKAGTLGHAGAFSFYPTKNLGALGDGGAVFSSSAAVNDKIHSLRQYGWGCRHISERQGINSRLDEIQAAILRVKLPYLSTWNHRRKEIASRYDHGLKDLVQTPFIHAENTCHVFHQYTIRTPDRGNLCRCLKEEEIGTSILYPIPLHLQPAYLDRYPSDPAGLSETEKAAAEILCLPIYPELEDVAVDRICRAICNGLQNSGKVSGR